MGMHSPGEQIEQSRTDNEGPPGPKGTQGRGGKQTRVAGPGGEDGSGTKAGWTAGARCGKGWLGAPSCVPRPSRPRRPSAGPGPGSDRRPPPAEARAGKSDQTTRPLPVRHRDRGTRIGSRGRKWRGAVRGSPLKPRGLGSRLCGGGVLRPAGRRPSPGQHHPARGPLTSPSQPPQPPQAWKSVRHGRSAPGPAPLKSMRSRLRSRGSAASERYLRSTGPGPRPRPWRSPLPLALRPALSGARPRPLRAHVPPPWGFSCCGRAGANRDFKIWSLFPALAPGFPREREACVNKRREPSRSGRLRDSVERWSKARGAPRGQKWQFKAVEIALGVILSPSRLLSLQPRLSRFLRLC